MDAKPKRPYEKPVIERIELLGEEMVATPNCKRTTGGGKNMTFPSACRITGGTTCRDSRGS
jgi:hypothetical protein